MNSKKQHTTQNMYEIIKLLEEMTEVPQGMRVTSYLKEALIDDIHPTIKGLELIEDVEQMDHLMAILVTMGHLVREDILQDMDHQEEDCLVPLAHLEILDPLDKEDHQA